MSEELKVCPLQKEDGGTITFGRWYDCVRDCVNRRADCPNCATLKKALEDRGNLLEDVINELDLSECAIEKHGPLGTPPAELVRLVLAEKDMKISALKNGLADCASLKKAFEEAKKEVEELKYRLRLCGIDNPLPAEEEKRQCETCKHDSEFCFRTIGTCISKNLKGHSKWTPKEEKNYKSPLHYCPHGIRITETCVDCGRKA